jgi:hypothetical protein
MLCFGGKNAEKREKPQAVIRSCIRLLQSLEPKGSQMPIWSLFDAAAEIEDGDLLSSLLYHLFRALHIFAYTLRV